MELGIRVLVLEGFWLALCLIFTVTGADENLAFIDRETLQQVSSHIIQKEEIFTPLLVQEERVQNITMKAEEIRQRLEELGAELKDKVISAQKINQIRQHVEHVHYSVGELRKRLKTN